MKNILITGSTDGIGKLTAIKLAIEGHSVFIHGRNSEKLEATINEIKEISKNENIQGFIADFSNLKEVKQLAEELKNKISNLDILINNAGIYKSSTSENKNGFDMRYVVNYFAPYTLSNLLLPLLKKSKNARIINLSSAAQAPVNTKTLVGESKEMAGATYAQSKLALTMWSFYLAKVEPELTVIPVNPGSLLNTKMVKEAFGKHWSPADKGAEILFDLAISEKHKNHSGKYFDNDQGSFGNAHADAYDLNKIDQLIKLTKGVLA